ncbi:MAG: GIY-YIG nuclease family protein [Planctomycetaceae bacterium]|nr:GIY-YIG nuclease family protein [Planctomycetaceae bacterium]
MLSERSESKHSPAPATGNPLWYVYILLCCDGAYYVGVTIDLERRCTEHFTGRGGHYTKCNPPLRLAWHESHPTRAAAEARERQLKGWTRRKKEALIAGDLALLKRI